MPSTVKVSDADGRLSPKPSEAVAITVWLPLESAVVGVGATVRGANCRGLHDLGRVRTIEQRDVNRAVERAKRVRLPEDAMILQMFPQDFVVDGHPGHRDPRKMIAGQIEANVHLLMTSQREHDCVVTAVNQAHLAVEETACEALAASYAGVMPEDRREGCVVAERVHRVRRERVGAQGLAGVGEREQRGFVRA